MSDCAYVWCLLREALGQGHRDGTAPVAGPVSLRPSRWDARKRVALVNKPVAPDVAAVAANGFEGPVLFLKITAVAAAVEV